MVHPIKSHETTIFLWFSSGFPLVFHSSWDPFQASRKWSICQWGLRAWPRPQWDDGLAGKYSKIICFGFQNRRYSLENFEISKILQVIPRSSIPKPCPWIILIYPLVMTNIGIDNGHRKSEFGHSQLWLSIVMLVYQRISRYTNPAFNEGYPVPPKKKSTAIVWMCHHWTHPKTQEITSNSW